MTRKQTLKVIAELYNENTCNIYKETQCLAEVDGNKVVIKPINADTTFYHMETVSELAKLFQLNCYIKYQDGNMMAVIF